MPDFCNRELKELSNIVNAETKTTEDSIQYYKALLDYKHVTINAELTDEAADNVRAGLAFERQYLVYLDALRVRIAYLSLMPFLLGTSNWSGKAYG